MRRQSQDYTICPDCKRRTVLFHFGRNGEDYYRCHYRINHGDACNWEEFVEPEGWDTTGQANLARYHAVNPPPAEGGS